MTETDAIFEQLPAPRFTKLGDIATRFTTPVANATAAWILDPELRTPVQRQPPEVLETAMRNVLSGLPGLAGVGLRARFGIDADEQRLAAAPDMKATPQALVAAAGYGEMEIQAAHNHDRQMSADELLTGNDLDDIVTALGEDVPGISRLELEVAARLIHQGLERELTQGLQR